MDGIGLIPVIMGLFGVPEVLLNIEQSLKREVYQTRIANLLPTLRDWKQSIAAMLRGSFLGLGLFYRGPARRRTFDCFPGRLFDREENLPPSRVVRDGRD